MRAKQRAAGDKRYAIERALLNYWRLEPAARNHPRKAICPELYKNWLTYSDEPLPYERQSTFERAVKTVLARIRPRKRRV